MNEICAELLRNYLEDNAKERVEICRDINCYDGSMDFVDAWDLEELCHCFETYDIARAIIYGNVTNVCDRVRWNGYGKLETVSDYEIETESEDYIEDIINWIDNHGTRYINHAVIDEIVDDYEDIDDLIHTTTESVFEDLLDEETINLEECVDVVIDRINTDLWLDNGANKEYNYIKEYIADNFYKEG